MSVARMTTGAAGHGDDATRWISATIAAVVALVPGVLFLASHPTWDPLDSPITLTVVGLAVVLPLAWRLGPDALGARRTWQLALLKMAVAPVIIGGPIIAFATVAVEATAEGPTLANTVGASLAMWAIGIIALGPCAIAFLTFPSAVLWIWVLRTAALLLGRRVTAASSRPG